MTILIECTLKRPGGTTVEMSGGAFYHFKDDGLGNHVAAVSNTDHLSRFLGIPEAYRIFSADDATVAPAQGLPATTPPISTHNSGPVVMLPQQPDPTATPAAVQPVAVPEAKALDAMDDAELRATFKAEIGRAPAPKSKPETMIAQIEAIRAERAAAQG